jgi:transcriptional regulator with XRE-family HTH domain
MLGEALRLIRVFHDLKQTQAAERLKISKSYLSEIESGSKEPTLQLISRYADVFDLPASSILFFAESIKDTRPRARARQFVAGRIAALLRFLDERGGPNGEAT